MRNPGPADLYLARLLRKSSSRATIYIVLFVTATAIVYLKIVEGRADERPASYLGLFCFYGFLMSVMARDSRCRIAYLSFGTLVAAAYSRGLLSAYPVATGLVELISCLVLLIALMSLARDPDFLSLNPVLQSGALNPNQILEDSDAQARADSPSDRDTRHEPGSGQGERGEGGR